MSNDFQNGFLCGMATKGLIKTGDPYTPNVWNDTGVYSYFYIDFKRVVADFSLGMLKESVFIRDIELIPITSYEYVSPGVYKIYADISGKVKGLSVTNRAETYLTFANGSKVPPFSIVFYVAGLNRYDTQYIYEKTYNGATAPLEFAGTITESTDMALSGNTLMNEVSESVYDAKTLILAFASTVTESATVALT